MTDQLGLTLSLGDDATFDNYYSENDPVRSQLVSLLKDGIPSGENLLYLWGGGGAGGRHLLQASCQYFLASGRSAQYLPLEDVVGLDADALLDGIEHVSLCCLDGLQLIGTHRDWQKAIFNLYNRVRDCGNLLLVHADRPPRELPLELADLQSRLCGGLTYHLAPYTDEDKRAIVQFRAQRLGMHLGDDVAAYILSRGSRSLERLMGYLAELDCASIKAQRRITIPFVKEVFHW